MIRSLPATGQVRGSTAHCWCVLGLCLVLAGCSQPPPKPAVSGSRHRAEKPGSPREVEPLTADEEPSTTATEHAEPEVPPSDNYDPEVGPLVRIETSRGVIDVRLYPQQAPRTVSNFLNYVDSGAYDGSIFHQIVAGYLVLGGAFTDKLEPLPEGPPITNEAATSPPNRRGTIAMARRLDSADSATRQFFFNLADNRPLDHQGEAAEQFGYCVFGEVVAGWSVLESIARTPVCNRPGFEMLPVATVKIVRVSRHETPVERLARADVARSGGADRRESNAASSRPERRTRRTDDEAVR